jgi:hypothetical protein
MKKTTVIKFATATLAIALFSVPAISQASQFRGADGGTCLNMVDLDGDGIAESRPERGSGTGANATNFVDANGDGECDTLAAGGQQLLDGSGDALQTQLEAQQQLRQRTRTNR